MILARNVSVSFFILLLRQCNVLLVWTVIHSYMNVLLFIYSWWGVSVFHLKNSSGFLDNVVVNSWPLLVKLCLMTICVGGACPKDMRRYMNSIENIFILFRFFWNILRETNDWWFFFLTCFHWIVIKYWNGTSIALIDTDTSLMSWWINYKVDL